MLQHLEHGRKKLLSCLQRFERLLTCNKIEMKSERHTRMIQAPKRPFEKEFSNMFWALSLLIRLCHPNNFEANCERVMNKGKVFFANYSLIWKAVVPLIVTILNKSAKDL